MENLGLPERIRIVDIQLLISRNTGITLFTKDGLRCMVKGKTLKFGKQMLYP